MNKALKVLKSGQGIQEAMKESGLSELEVIKLNKQLLQKTNGNIENDSEDEQKR